MDKVIGSPAPTGAVVFRRYSTTTCTGPSVDQVVNTASTYKFSQSYTTTAGPHSYRLSYVGDGFYFPVDSACLPLVVAGQTHDFNGNGTSDPAITRPGAGGGGQALWWAPTTGLTVPWPNTASDVVVPADYDGDGKNDIMLFRPNANSGPDQLGLWFGQRSSNAAVIQIAFGLPGDIAIPGDYDGDGKADFASSGRRPGSGSGSTPSRTSSSSIHAPRVGPFGGPGDVAVPADYDGDGKTDIAIFRPSPGIWYGFKAANATVVLNSVATSGPFGATGDIAIPADFDGDGKIDPPSTGHPSGSGCVEGKRRTGARPACNFGGQGHVPVPADYDADGRADMGDSIRRPMASSPACRAGGRSIVGLRVFARRYPGRQAAERRGDGLPVRPAAGQPERRTRTAAPTPIPRPTPTAMPTSTVTPASSPSVTATAGVTPTPTATLTPTSAAPSATPTLTSTPGTGAATPSVGITDGVGRAPMTYNLRSPPCSR